jgi:hypothetical protein
MIKIKVLIENFLLCARRRLRSLTVAPARTKSSSKNTIENINNIKTRLLKYK